ncbi:hypothetical protein C8J57DRAFT_1727302 [Mycena rebaudengoi]|nr:hypothetical protein C8J57DRAFT_1727302 [Mycena rebaudengoi]
MASEPYKLNVYGGRGGDGGRGGGWGGAGGTGEGPTLHIHGRTSITTETVRHGETGIHILHQAVALQALYDSADSFPQPRCYPETRGKMLETLFDWAVQDDSLGDWAPFPPDPTPPICWLHGPAGAGKSAIMQTLCRNLQKAGRLGGAFFFKRGHPTRGNANVLFATLAYQLALNNRNLHSPISQSVEDNPSVVGRSMDVQLRQLIVEPCTNPHAIWQRRRQRLRQGLRQSVEDDPSVVEETIDAQLHQLLGEPFQSLTDCPPLILLIDGLDECYNESTQQEIIRLIRGSVAVHREFRAFRFLVASRPEAHIRETFEDHSLNGILDSIHIKRSFEDIWTYFLGEFARIHREHRTMVDVPTPWPSFEILANLVDKSSGYFVYASTVIKFIDDRDFHPTQRLTIIQNLSPSEFDVPFAALDQLYTQILSDVPAQFRSILRDILQSTIVANLQITPVQLERLFDLEPGEVQLILRRLHSVLDVPSNSGTISVFHASFSDFLQDERRSTIFHLDLESRTNVARAVLKALSDDNHWLDDPNHPLAW